MIVTTENRPSVENLRKMHPHSGRQLWIWGAAAIALVLLAGWYFLFFSSSPRIIYDTSSVEKDDLIVTVIATGTVQPTTKVELSSELSGTIAAVDVDYNDHVSEGQVLAQLDDTKLKANVVNAEAQLAAARARLDSSEATVAETNEELKSSEALQKRGVTARQTYISAKAAYDRAVAAVDNAKADVTLAEANLASQKADLEKSQIRSPITGVVLSRNVEKGQIVAASLNAPILFTLAEDLARMELRVAIDEADIGRVKVGQNATFTVDAYPGRKFDAVIKQLRYAPDEGVDVVSYTAVLSVNNDELLLRPGMTATATITVREVKDALTVPVAALRYAPPATASGGNSGGRGLVGLIMPRSQRERSRAGDGRALWVLRKGEPERVAIEAGESDGTRIAVTSDSLAEGDKVILGQREAS